ncbi:hypothetical protein [Streptomyces sp. NBC_00328]|uniref:hypothetical protein n=1 Tax=Streptomyces sp. NBC_00328 TaxID=2903646 RepID=UPI002E2CA86C|nr:hypothetical protein [Streptomyces sp. NBC_00328]
MKIEERDSARSYAASKGWKLEVAEMTWQGITTCIDRWTKAGTGMTVTVVWVHSPDVYPQPYWAKGHWEAEGKKGRIESMMSAAHVTTVSLQRALDGQALG